MRKTIAILVLGSLPTLAAAGGDHDGGHDGSLHGGHHVERMGHGAHGMHDAPPHKHATAAAAGRPGNPDLVSRTIVVTMSDTMRFDPAEMNFKTGDTVRFAVKNGGRIRHEMVIGSVAELREHAELMRKMPDMQHEEPNMISLAPGESGELVWEFDTEGAFDFACLVPGHLEAGMTGKIVVNGKPL